MKRTGKFFTGFALFLLAACGNAASTEENLARIKLPPGFAISIYAEGLAGPRQLALGDQGTVFAGSNKAGTVYAVVDGDSNYLADGTYVVASGLQLSAGVEFRFGSLYVGALDQILRYDDIESSLDQPPPPEVITSTLPDRTHHGKRYLRFGPDDFLYFGVGAPCNVCLEPGFGQIRRMYADGSGEEVFVSGVRNSVGIVFNPADGSMWFTDNGRDMLGDDIPSDELNHVTQAGQDFGFPYCHQGDLLDPQFGEGKSCADYTPPAVMMGPHVAALGLAFNNGDMFPAEYRGALFIARHGSWNRSEKIGYDLAVVRFDAEGQPLEAEVFASGWLQGQSAWGRPADVMQLPDGSLLVSDDAADVIYRISYSD